LVPYGIFGVGCLLVVLGFGTQLAGKKILYQTLSAEGSAGSTVYTSKQVQLKEGLHDFRLSIRGLSKILNIGGFSFTISSPERPSWFHDGSLRTRSSRSSRSTTSSRRRRAEDKLLIKIEEPGAYTFVVTFDEGLTRSLDLSVTKVYTDYRIPLVIGLILAGVGALMSPELRSLLGRVNLRFGR
jgi:hypothetical protein